MLPMAARRFPSSAYPRGDVFVDEKGRRLDISFDDANRLQAGKRAQRKGLCYSTSYVEREFDIFDPADGNVLLVVCDDEGAESELEAWYIDEDERVLTGLVEDAKLLLCAHQGCREGDGLGKMVGAGEHARCAYVHPICIPALQCDTCMH